MTALEPTAKYLMNLINNELFRIGFLFRSYYRCKTIESIDEKIIRKNYKDTGRKIQDAIGIRINLYFYDDIPTVINLISGNFELINREIDKFDTETFRPARNNLVFKIPESHINEFEGSTKQSKKPIDSTFEVQIRSVLSEGWHEVEHDLRYKCKEDWEGHEDLGRILNGIYATLETGEWAMLRVFNELSYNNYKSESWEALLRNKFRLRIKNTPPLDDSIIELMNKNSDIAKQIFRIGRELFLKRICESKLHIPLTYNNIIYTINHIFIRCGLITELTPLALLDDLNTCFNSELTKENYFTAFIKE